MALTYLDVKETFSLKHSIIHWYTQAEWDWMQTYTRHFLQTNCLSLLFSLLSNESFCLIYYLSIIIYYEKVVNVQLRIPACEVTSPDCLVCLANSPKCKYIQITMLKNREKSQILTVEDPEKPENIQNNIPGKICESYISPASQTLKHNPPFTLV